MTTMKKLLQNAKKKAIGTIEYVIIALVVWVLATLAINNIRRERELTLAREYLAKPIRQAKDVNDLNNNNVWNIIKRDIGKNVKKIVNQETLHKNALETFMDWNIDVFNFRNKDDIPVVNFQWDPLDCDMAENYQEALLEVGRVWDYVITCWTDNVVLGWGWDGDEVEEIEQDLTWKITPDHYATTSNPVAFTIELQGKGVGENDRIELVDWDYDAVETKAASGAWDFSGLTEWDKIVGDWWEKTLVLTWRLDDNLKQTIGTWNFVYPFKAEVNRDWEDKRPDWLGETSVNLVIEIVDTSVYVNAEPREIMVETWEDFSFNIEGWGASTEIENDSYLTCNSNCSVLWLSTWSTNSGNLEESFNNINISDPWEYDVEFWIVWPDSTSSTNVSITVTEPGGTLPSGPEKYNLFVESSSWGDVNAPNWEIAPDESITINAESYSWYSFDDWDWDECDWTTNTSCEFAMPENDVYIKWNFTKNDTTLAQTDNYQYEVQIAWLWTWTVNGRSTDFNGEFNDKQLLDINAWNDSVIESITYNNNQLSKTDNFVEDIGDWILSNSVILEWNSSWTDTKTITVKFSPLNQVEQEEIVIKEIWNEVNNPVNITFRIKWDNKYVFPETDEDQNELIWWDWKFVSTQEQDSYVDLEVQVQTGVEYTFNVYWDTTYWNNSVTVTPQYDNQLVELILPVKDCYNIQNINDNVLSKQVMSHIDVNYINWPYKYRKRASSLWNHNLCSVTRLNVNWAISWMWTITDLTGISQFKEMNFLAISEQKNIDSGIADINSLTWLQELYVQSIGANNIENIDFSIFSDLFSTNFAHNNLGSYVNDTLIGQLESTSITHIDMKDSVSWAEDIQNIGNLSTLIWLDLSNNNLSSLPDSIAELSNLEALRLWQAVRFNDSCWVRAELSWTPNSLELGWERNWDTYSWENAIVSSNYWDSGYFGGCSNYNVGSAEGWQIQWDWFVCSENGGKLGIEKNVSNTETVSADW